MNFLKILKNNFILKILKETFNFLKKNVKKVLKNIFTIVGVCVVFFFFIALFNIKFFITFICTILLMYIYLLVFSCVCSLFLFIIYMEKVGRRLWHMGIPFKYKHKPSKILYLYLYFMRNMECYLFNILYDFYTDFINVVENDLKTTKTAKTWSFLGETFVGSFYYFVKRKLKFAMLCFFILNTMLFFTVCFVSYYKFYVFIVWYTCGLVSFVFLLLLLSIPLGIKKFFASSLLLGNILIK